jgi:hypothetical protein
MQDKPITNGECFAAYLATEDSEIYPYAHGPYPALDEGRRRAWGRLMRARACDPSDENYDAWLESMRDEP